MANYSKSTTKKRSLKEKLNFFPNINIEKDLQEEPSPKFEKQKLFTLTKNKLFLSILAFMILVNILIFFNLNQFYIRATFAFLFIVTIPGLLIMLMLKIREVGFWEYLVYNVGLSISFIMFGGLVINWILPWLNITDKPLSLYPILICFDIFLIVFWITAWIRNKDFNPLKIQYPKLDTINRIFFVVPMLFPVLSILGAFLLNNHGTNILTMIMLGGIAVYVFCVVLFRKKLNENVFPWALYWMGLSLLLMYSMRSWFFMGSDIVLEYHYFQFTIEKAFWSMSNTLDAYNSCLSLTILPTILFLFIKINNLYIFKLIMQLIFSLTPIALYLLINRYCKEKVFFSFISAFVFMSAMSFTIDMPAHIRQAIAFLFFSLMILALFNKEIGSMIRKIFFLIFGFSMIVSHYSTSYITFALFIMTYILVFFYQKYKNGELKNDR
ncbi:DUF2206 domain-containing protein [Patescibacteria group bacterium]|nr:DUF2206 domain-containing protein [Patescibacteria group bacterium]